ncbi:MAG: hypothetical protein ABJF11_12500 [Reichenbachiella sp.]|uniref:hypothetical protein n=1 Tax=Reichenbachiella sp. TaxID=2184521 RepID=UPI00326774E7
MIKQLLLIAFISNSLFSCTQRASDPSAPPEEKHPSELTYIDIYNLALAAENGGGLDFHGDAFGNEATGDISIYASGNCSKDNCGKSLIMENKNTEKSIGVVIKAKFKLPGNKINEMVRLYQLSAGQTTSIGCSHICHQDNSYMIQREIISAGYVEIEIPNKASIDSTMQEPS